YTTLFRSDLDHRFGARDGDGAAGIKLGPIAGVDVIEGDDIQPARAADIANDIQPSVRSDQRTGHLPDVTVAAGGGAGGHPAGGGLGVVAATDSILDYPALGIHHEIEGLDPRARADFGVDANIHRMAGDGPGSAEDRRLHAVGLAIELAGMARGHAD